MSRFQGADFIVTANEGDAREWVGEHTVQGPPGVLAWPAHMGCNAAASSWLHCGSAQLYQPRCVAPLNLFNTVFRVTHSEGLNTLSTLYTAIVWLTLG